WQNAIPSTSRHGSVPFRVPSSSGISEGSFTRGARGRFDLVVTSPRGADLPCSLTASPPALATSSQPQSQPASRRHPGGRPGRGEEAVAAPQPRPRADRSGARDSPCRQRRNGRFSTNPYGSTPSKSSPTESEPLATPSSK